MSYFLGRDPIFSLSSALFTSHIITDNKHYALIEEVLKKNDLLYPLDVLLVGATGVGKSSTLNAIFGDKVAKVGEGVAPETKTINTYEVTKYFRIHDSAGLGDGKTADDLHSKSIIDKLSKRVSTKGLENNGFIDLVLVILDGSLRDLGTTFNLLQNVIVPNISADRIIIAINQADIAMKGRYWDFENKKPKHKLLEFLKEKAITTKERLQPFAKGDISLPVFYSAYYDWNVDELVNNIIAHIPKSRRILG